MNLTALNEPVPNMTMTTDYGYSIKLCKNHHDSSFAYTLRCHIIRTSLGTHVDLHMHAVINFTNLTSNQFYKEVGFVIFQFVRHFFSLYS